MAALCLATPPVHGQVISQASIRKDGSVQLVERGGATKIISPQPGQAGAVHLRIAPDRRTVAWEVLHTNCCTSYPIPLALNAYRNGKKVSISPNGLMVWQWHFVAGGKQVAVLYGPTHGFAAGANLYSTRNGKLVVSCTVPCKAPRWANAWQAELATEPEPKNPPPRSPR